jgi:hypothetical protein
MRLKNSQKMAVLSWIAEGIDQGEIDERARNFEPPFQISRAMTSKYRKTRGIELQAMKSINESNALSSGFAVRENRVIALSRLAELMAIDLFGGLLWTDQVKGVGAGPAAEVVDYEEFNSAEVAQFRGVLGDIADETGGRVKKSELTGPDGKELPAGQVVTLYLPTNNRDTKPKK